MIPQNDFPNPFPYGYPFTFTTNKCQETFVVNMKNCCFQLPIWYQSSKLSYIKTVLIRQYYFFSLATTFVRSTTTLPCISPKTSLTIITFPNQTQNYISMQISYFQIPTFDLASLDMSWYLHSEKLPSRCWGFPTCTARGWFNFMQTMLLFDKKWYRDKNDYTAMHHERFRLHNFACTTSDQPLLPCNRNTRSAVPLGP